MSLTNDKDLPALDDELHIQHQHLPIEDIAYEDILMSLEGLCAWVNNALTMTETPGHNVLVHCKQGTSRSGAIIVALLMRSRSLDYESALALARESRASIAPNSGFADQLRLWRTMNYSISEEASQGNGPRKTKLQYEQWRRDRGILLTKAEETKQEAVRRAMEDMAVEFGLGTVRHIATNKQ